MCRINLIHNLLINYFDYVICAVFCFEFWVSAFYNRTQGQYSNFSDSNGGGVLHGACDAHYQSRAQPSRFWSKHLFSLRLALVFVAFVCLAIFPAS